MSVSFSAIAAFGCRVPRDSLRGKTRKRGCSCLGIVDGIRHCPYCGRKIWIEVDEWIFDTDRREFDGLEVCGSTDDRELFICAVSVGCDEIDSSMVRIGEFDIDTLRSQVKLILDKYGLWNDKEWGLWVIPHVSY